MEVGLILVDEHNSLACIVCDRRRSEILIVMPDTAMVPERFVIATGLSLWPQVCVVRLRTEETISAQLLHECP